MKGLSSLLDRLQGLSGLADECAQAAGREAMYETADYARRIVPVRTGRLRASISPEEKDGHMQVTVRCPYAVYVELGTRFMAAQPYLLPGVHQADYFARAVRAWKDAMK